MANLKIKNAPLIPNDQLDSSVKIPTGGKGTYSVDLGQIAQFTKNSLSLINQTDVDVISNEKADKHYVDAQDSSLQSQIDQKATAAYLDSELAAQTQAVNTALSQLSTAATKFYPTLAEANANIADIEVNQPVQVGESGTNGGLWYKATAESTTLTKSAYDPLTQAKVYTDTSINTIFKEPYNLLNKTIISSGGVSPSGGAILSSVWSKTDFVAVKVGDKVSYNVYGGTTVAFAAAYNSDKVFLRDLSPYSTLSVQQKIGELEIVDNDVAFVRFSFRVDNGYTYNFIKKDLNIKPSLIDIVDISDQVWIDINGDINLFDASKTFDGKYLINNVEKSLSTWFTSDFISVESGKYYTTNGTAGGSTEGVGIHFYDSNKNFVSVGAKQTANTPFLIPSGVNFIRLSYAKSLSPQISETWVVSGTEYKVDILAEKIKEVIDDNPVVADHRYKNKVLMTLGDSITDSLSTSFTYPPIVANYFGMTLFDGGWSGRRIRNAFGRSTIASDANILASHIITIAHGTNDFKLETSIGTIDDSPTSKATLDTASYNATTNQTDGTFYADYKGVIEHILTVNPQARIMLITPIRRTQAASTGTDTNAKGHKLVDYVNAIKAIAEYYGLPVLDNYNTSGFNTKTIPTWTSDGLHPTEWAQRHVVSQKVIGFIESN